MFAFFGAIHTRYSYVFGTMHITRKIADLLTQKIDNGKRELKPYTEKNSTTPQVELELIFRPLLRLIIALHPLLYLYLPSPVKSAQF